MAFSDFSGGLGAGFAPAGTYQSGPSDGNYPGQQSMGSASAGSPNWNHSAVVVCAIVIGAVALLILGVIGFRASGEIVI